ncbi:GCN5-related N-acetyltransferase [Kribbella flavida DSM 17836]|uniref:GCN5-related N-acetyltransferase n=1 Tax=Kribbella flavida (strain DSM 17836 / JCM 10339 / NBRC 14399) TaxID=479435 RepID=D2PU45_KRIFD|nr:GNAT family N-acetyltransferase [Kribbella flavida]ADB35096.1 GCN5-related N-acetyltransferase [Kribbella flavida DSM 17836]
MSTLTFRRVTRDDFPLLAQWLANPHVERWWNHETDPAAVERDFGASADGREPSEDFLLLVDEQPAGLIQRSRLTDYPEELETFAELTDVPDGAVIVDYFIGATEHTGQGLGTAMIAAMVAKIWTELPATPAVLAAVVAANRNSWRALERAGFRRVAEGPMEPDNPVDDPLHYVYRLDRPAA